MCKIISIANQKGGVGKTTTAMNLGVALELQGKHTLLIDFDPQASLSSYLGFINDNGDNIDELPTINNLMMSAIGLERKSEDIMSYIRHSEVNNIDYIPSDLNLANADCYLSGRNKFFVKFALLLVYFIDYGPHSSFVHNALYSFVIHLIASIT